MILRLHMGCWTHGQSDGSVADAAAHWELGELGERLHS